ncbi:phage holin family protein [Flavobacterium agricola]|uniref:Phage holin family protein n=1 Tax=Flavobacterium agricola TaxID=2870839 RepID=A0ABY6LXN0_9FLAO|nr:phage holin family protein [Flavobacterium agricola]UYW00737.1 phage holin family protein [Flavobacterium agricola]
MALVLDFIITSLIILLLANFLPGIQVTSWWSALGVAIILALLNTFIKPVLVFFTFPITVVTFGLFLFVINAVIVILAGKLINGFQVSGFWYALLFSIVLSFAKGIIDSIFVSNQQ